MRMREGAPLTGSHDDELANPTVQSLGSLVGTLLELLVVRSLLDQIEDLVRQLSVGEGESLGVGSGAGHCVCASVDVVVDVVVDTFG
jgi:hypothetical protein